MRTVGELLRTAREKKKITLDEVVAKTKIKRHFLEAIEVNRFQELPSEVAARGFIKNYAEFLGLPSGQILRIFKRDFGANPKGKVVSQVIFKTAVGQPRFRWGPKMTLASVVFLVFLILLVYLGYQYLSSVRKPELRLFQPQPGEQLLEKKVEIRGKTDPDAVVTVNGKLVSLSPKGEFSFTLLLLPGENKILVEATGRWGKKSRIERIVYTSIQKEQESNN